MWYVYVGATLAFIPCIVVYVAVGWLCYGRCKQHWAERQLASVEEEEDEPLISPEVPDSGSTYSDYTDSDPENSDPLRYGCLCPVPIGSEWLGTPDPALIPEEDLSRASPTPSETASIKPTSDPSSPPTSSGQSSRKSSIEGYGTISRQNY